MNKDKSWLKEQIEKEVHYEHMVGDVYYATREEIIGLIDQLNEVKLPVIPEYVANTIVYLQRRELEEGVIPKVVSVSDLGDKLDVDDFNNTQEWVSKNFRKYAFAYAVGYEIEEEKYYILLPKIKRNWKYVSLRSNHDELIDHYTDSTEDLQAFTEKEIKAFDPRYWAFADPVEEIME